MEHQRSLSTFSHQGHHKVVTSRPFPQFSITENYSQNSTEENARAGHRMWTHSRKRWTTNTVQDCMHKHVGSHCASWTCTMLSLTIVSVISRPALRRPEIGGLQKNKPFISAQLPWTHAKRHAAPPPLEGEESSPLLYSEHQLAQWCRPATSEESRSADHRYQTHSSSGIG